MDNFYNQDQIKQKLQEDQKQYLFGYFIIRLCLLLKN